MNPLRSLNGVVRIVRTLLHVVGGLWTIRTRFPSLSVVSRQQLVQAWSLRMLGILGVELRLSGAAPAPGPVLVVANHISWLDILVMNAARPAHFVSKSDVKHWPLLGTLITGVGTLYIERESRRDAMRVVHHMVEALREGDVVAVFPEGTTGDGRELLPFHANVLQAAIAAPAPIQPVALAYVDAQTGQRSDAPTYIGDTTLLASIWRTITSPPLVAAVRLGDTELANGRDRRVWANDLRAGIQTLASDAVSSGPITAAENAR